MFYVILPRAGEACCHECKTQCTEDQGQESLTQSPVSRAESAGTDLSWQPPHLGDDELWKQFPNMWAATSLCQAIKDRGVFSRNDHHPSFLVSVSSSFFRLCVGTEKKKSV